MPSLYNQHVSHSLPSTNLYLYSSRSSPKEAKRNYINNNVMPRRSKNPPVAEAVASAPEAAEPLFFYGAGNKYGEFSQWYHANFSVSNRDIYNVVQLPTDDLEDPDGKVDFITAEQFMMYCKAVCFGDMPIAWEILEAETPREQKALGRRVQGFTDQSWNAVKRQVVELANVTKFGQNEEIKAILLGTGQRELIEASPRDRIWGIGFGEKTGRATMHSRRNWGQNLLGKALVGARERIRKEDEATSQE